MSTSASLEHHWRDARELWGGADTSSMPTVSRYPATYSSSPYQAPWLSLGLERSHCPSGRVLTVPKSPVRCLDNKPSAKFKGRLFSLPSWKAWMQDTSNVEETNSREAKCLVKFIGERTLS